MIFGIDDAIIASVASAAIAGGASMYGANQANQTNIDLNAANREFQSNEAKTQRDYNAGLFASQQGQAWDMFKSTQDFNSAQAAEAATRNQNLQWLQWDQAHNEAMYARDWTANMSNTAYQRATADMRAAGLNPLLAYSQGGAATPGAAAPTLGSASSPSASSGGGSSPSPLGYQRPQGSVAQVQNVMGGAVGSALQAGSLISTIEQMRAATRKTEADTAVSRAQAANVEANTILSLEQGKSEPQNRARTMADVNRIHRASSLLQQQAETSAVEANLLGTRAGESSALTVESQQRTRESQAREFHQRLENDRFQNYGPRGRLQDLGASGEAIGGRAAAAARTPEAIEMYRRGYAYDGSHPIHGLIRQLRELLQ